MADALIRMGVSGAQDYDNLATRLRRQGEGVLQERLRSRIRTAGRPVERDIKSAALRLRVTGERGGSVRPKGDSHLRARVAAAVGTSVTRTGIRFTVDSNRVDPHYGGALVRYLDAEGNYARWRHPVFNTGVWRQNRSSGGFFFAVVRSRRGEFEAAVGDAMDDTVRDLTS